MKAAKTILKRDAGIALLTTLLLLLLMSSLMVAFILMVVGGAKLTGLNDDYSKAYYASEAGMEKLTADLGNLFDQNFAPSGAAIGALQNTPPPLTGITYVNAVTGLTGYTIDFPKDGNGNPRATNSIVKSGPYQGMTALATPYTLTVTAHTDKGSEVELQRTTQTVGIPMFQFGVFSDTDLSFFPGPKFSFGGRTHTNGNLFLAAGTELDLLDRVTAVKDVIRTNLSNGVLTSINYNGPVNIAKSSGSPPPTRTLAMTEGSLVGTLGSGSNPSWQSISMGSANYNGFLRGATTAPPPLNLAIATLGSGFTQTIDLIRRPPGPENNLVTAERYFAQASMHILLSDNPQDIMNLPCVDPTTQPLNLADLARPTATWNDGTSANAGALFTNMTNNDTAGLSTTPVPLAASGAASLTTYKPLDGYWEPTGKPIIKGFIKIEVQKGYGGTPCNGWKDVTIEVLALGYAGKNINPDSITPPSKIPPLPPLNSTPQGQLSQVDNPAAVEALVPTRCYLLDPHPNAIIRLERIRDNPSTQSLQGGCGVTVVGGKVTARPTGVTDYWPNTLFDTREGTLRDTAPSNTAGVGPIPYNQMVSLAGVMQYIEVDAANLGKYFTGALGTNGNLAVDPLVAPNNFTVYISDRRGNYAATQTWLNWPPLSPSLHETGEYGNTDVVNATSSPAAGCPNNATEAGEDLDQTGQSYVYGEDPTHALLAYNSASPWQGGNGYFSTILNGISPFTPNSFCTSPSVPNTQLWPGTLVEASNEARENTNPFFRRAIKIVHGSFLNLGNCPGSSSGSPIPCGLTIATENPAYIQGDFNANSQGNGWKDPHVATSVSADAVTFLSNNWNDYNSFLFPYQKAGAPGSPNQYTPGTVSAGNVGQRGAETTFYRVAIVAGKGVSFPQPGGTNPADFGTDGGVHNFLRFIESWGGQWLNYRGSIISLFYNRQAVGTYKCCNLVYDPPARGYNFDIEFLNPQLLPPRTPLFRAINTTGFTQLLLPNQ